MTAKVIPKSPNDTPEERLLRYLFIGKEYPVYHPGNWFVHGYYNATNVPSILELAAIEEKQTVPIELIKKVYQKTDLIQNLETLIFTLAVCARQKKSKKLREEAYNTVAIICKSPEHFILFVKFAHKLFIEEEAPKRGTGHGWKKCISKWYSEKTPIELAKCVAQKKGRYGWKHKDIIKLSHFKPSSQNVELILKYILYGYEEAKSAAKCPDPEAVEILKCFEQVENFRHCDDQVVAGRLIEVGNLNLDHVPAHLLTSEEVWTSLVNSMCLSMFLETLQRMQNLGFIKQDSAILGKALDLILNKENVESEKIQPAMVLITTKNYESSGKPLSFEKKKLKLSTKQTTAPVYKPNKQLLDGLYQTMEMSFANIQPTGLRYLIVINMNKESINNATWHNENVKVIEATCMIALSLRNEENVTIATFKSQGSHTETLEKKASFRETLEKLKQLPIGNTPFDKPMTWAASQNKEFDVFINIVENSPRTLVKSDEGIQLYRKKMNLPKTKLVNCALCASATYLKESFDKNILNICGFSGQVPKIIEAFSRSEF